MRLFRTLPTIAIRLVLASFALLLLGSTAMAGEADLAIPDLHAGTFTIAGQTITAWNLLFYGSFVIVGTLGISLYLRGQIKKLPAHKSMLDIAEIIFQTCKTYLIQQGKFLLMLFALIAVGDDVLLHGPARHETVDTALHRAAVFAVVGMGGSYCGRLVRHPRQHLRQLPAPPSPRSAASRGTWSTFRCAPACRSACS